MKQKLQIGESERLILWRNERRGTLLSKNDVMILEFLLLRLLKNLEYSGSAKWQIISCKGFDVTNEDVLLDRSWSNKEDSFLFIRLHGIGTRVMEGIDVPFLARWSANSLPGIPI